MGLKVIAGVGKHLFRLYSIIPRVSDPVVLVAVHAVSLQLEGSQVQAFWGKLVEVSSRNSRPRCAVEWFGSAQWSEGR